MGGVYEVDKTSGGSTVRTLTYYPVAGAMRIDSTLYYVLKDHLGSASVVTDAGGNVVGEQRYYPFGEARLTIGTLYTDRLFTGQREMAGLGVYHYGARFYSPKLARFLSADTIVPGYANPQNLNRYSYVNNSPLMYTDPTGHQRVSEGDEDGSDDGNYQPDPNPDDNGGGGGSKGGMEPKGDKQTQPDVPGFHDGYDTPDIPGQCDRPHCYDEREYGSLPAPISIRWKSWEEVDKIDLGVDAFGILGDVALTFGGPPGAIFWLVTEVPEFMTLGKSFDQVDLGDSTAVAQIVVDALGAGVDAAKLAPWGGVVANVVSIGLNVTEIEIYEPKPWPSRDE